MSNNGRYVGGGRKVVNDAVQKGLDSLITQSCTTKNGNRLQFHCGGSDGANQFFVLYFFFGQVFVHDDIVFICQDFQEYIPVTRSFIREFGRDGHFPEFSAEGLLFPYNGLHLQQVYHSNEILFGSPRQLEDKRSSPQTILDHINSPKEVSADSIHLVDESDLRYFIPVSLMPDCFRLGFYPPYSTEDTNGSIQDPQGPFHLDGKVHMAGSIYDVYGMSSPVARSYC